jgi:hypothetical protein
MCMCVMLGKRHTCAVCARTYGQAWGSEKLTCQDVHTISLASGATPTHCGSRACPIVDAFNARVSLDNFVVVISPMLCALQRQKTLSIWPAPNMPSQQRRATMLQMKRADQAQKFLGEQRCV